MKPFPPHYSPDTPTRPFSRESPPLIESCFRLSESVLPAGYSAMQLLKTFLFVCFLPTSFIGNGIWPPLQTDFLFVS